MKRAKKLTALVMVAALSVGSAITTQAVIIKGTVIPEDAYYTDAVSSNLDIQELEFKPNGPLAYGMYPVVVGMDELNEKIYADLVEAYDMMDDKEDADTFNNLTVTYSVEELDNGLVVLTTEAYVPYSTLFFGSETFVNNYYINVDENAELSEEEYEAILSGEELEGEEAEGEEAGEEEEVIDEDVIVMVPLRSTCETLGYEVNWIESIAAIEVSKDDFKTTLVTGRNAYATANGTNVELDAEPQNIDGTVYVPTSFFVEILGLEVVIDVDGNVEIIGDDGSVETEAEDNEDEAIDEQADDEQAADDSEDVAGEEEAADEATDEEAADGSDEEEAADEE